MVSKNYPREQNLREFIMTPRNSCEQNNKTQNEAGKIFCVGYENYAQILPPTDTQHASISS